MQEPRLLLRRRRRPDVDGRTHGKRINTERIDEALGTSPDTISTACPYCLVMLGDAISAKQAAGQARESLQVIDVAQLLARSVTTTAASGPANGSAAATDTAAAADGDPAAGNGRAAGAGGTSPRTDG